MEKQLTAPKGLLPDMDNFASPRQAAAALLTGLATKVSVYLMKINVLEVKEWIIFLTSFLSFVSLFFACLYYISAWTKNRLEIRRLRKESKG